MDSTWIAPRAGADAVLADGDQVLPHAQLRAGFAEFDRRFGAAGVVAGDGLVLAVVNSLATAWTLLYLLERGYDTVLLPSAAADDPVARPAFCRWLLTPRTTDDPVTPETAVRIAPNPQYWPGSALEAGAPRLMLRTSGSTGAPKLVAHTHRALRSNALRCVERFALTSADRAALPVPIHHMFGLGAGLLPAVVAGASVDLQQDANLLRFIARERAFDPSIAFMTPAFATTLLATRRGTRPYRLTVTAGDRFQADRLARYEAAFGAVIQLYGSTEQGAVAAAAAELPLPVRCRTVGSAMAGVELRVAAPVGEVGALSCRRDDGFMGYLDLQGRRLPSGHDAAGWWPTNDFARLDPSGHLEVLGRSDHSVNRDGLLVFFAEVERVIETLDSVASVAVTAEREEGPRGRRLIACCVAAADADPSPARIRAHCFDRLPPRAVPDEIHLIERLPLLANGKIDRLRLQAIYRGNTPGDDP